MRTAKYSFMGKEYLICMSGLVTTRLEAAGISLEKLDSSDKPTTDIFRILSFMIEAGNAYAKLFGIENPGVVSFEQLCAGTDLKELEQVGNLIKEIISGERKVEAEPPKNAEAPAKQ